MHLFFPLNRIDIPMYFVMGLSDTLIQPVSVIAHYSALEQHHPELAHLKAIPKIGHIDFTVGMNEALSRYILEVLHCKKDITRNK
jgi:cephalosporin-C deacetylase-like acetyl esterase